MKLQKLASKRLFDFIATAPTVDKVGDVVPEAELDEAFTGWMIRGAPINDFHTNRVIGKGINWEHKSDGKILVRGMVYDDSQVADEVWDKIKKEEYKMVSIGGAAYDKVDNTFGGKDLNDLEILEVSVCPSGAHPDADILDVNKLAKSQGFPSDGTPFFAKASILKSDAYSVTQVNQSTGSGSTALGVTGTGKNYSNPNGGTTMNVDVKKPDMPFAQPAAPTAPAPVQDSGYAEILKVLQDIKTMLAGAPSAAPEATAKTGGIGTADVNANPEGGNVLLPKNPQDKTEQQGVPGEQPEDKGSSLMQKSIDAAIEKAMGRYTKISTPRPDVEKTYSALKQSLPEWDIVRGRKTLDDFAKSSKIKRLEEELAKHRDFEAYFESESGKVN